MKTGILISGILHGIMLLLILFRLPWNGPEPDETLVMEVTTISAAEFEAVVSNTPAPPVMDIAAMAAPSADVNDAAMPDNTTAPQETTMDVTEDPADRDSDPDLTAVERLAQPEVAIIAAQPDAPDALPELLPNVSNGESGSSALPSFNAPPTPRAAPRIDSIAAPALPDDARVSDRVVEATTPDDTATDVVDEQQAEALPESVTEILPEAQPDVRPSAAPPRASLPPRRAAVAAVNDEIERLAQEADEEAVREALAALEGEISAPQAAPLTGAEQRSIGETVARNWNKSIVLGKENYERLVVKISVSVGPDGVILGDVQAIEPANPTGDFVVAFDAARRAVLRAGVIPLPLGQYPEGVRLILRFDPVLGIGLN